MNGVFTTTRNLLLLKTVSRLIRIKTTDFYNISTQKDSFGLGLGKVEAILMLQQVPSTDWKLARQLWWGNRWPWEFYYHFCATSAFAWVVQHKRSCCHTSAYLQLWTVFRLPGSLTPLIFFPPSPIPSDVTFPVIPRVPATGCLGSALLSGSQSRFLQHRELLRVWIAA
jgi:hypothetical protein